MRTKAQMIARAQRHVRDTAGQDLGDTTLVVNELQDAFRVLCNDLIVRRSGRRCLRKYSSATVLVASQEEYELPADCMLLDRVEVRYRDDDERWTVLGRREPPETGVRSGSSSLFAATGAVRGTGLYWWDDTDEGDIRIWPYLASIDEEKYRFRYFHRPTFPSDDDGDFNDPAHSGTDTDKVPDRFDEACEFFAAAMLSTEELEDGKPIGAFGRLYASTRDAIAGAAGSGYTKPVRRTVRAVRR